MLLEIPGMPDRDELDRSIQSMTRIIGYWPLGPVFCDIWLSLDYTMSNASVANLLVISFDRYMSVTRPLTYRIRRTRRRAAAMIAGAWVVSALLWTPWIMAWQYIEGGRSVPADDCYIQFLKSNEYLTIATAVAAFYLPVVILCVVYHRIYRETRRHQRKLYELQAAQLLRSRPVRKSAAADNEDADDETENLGCSDACRRRLVAGRRRRCGDLCWSGSADCDGSGDIGELHDDVQPTSMTTLMSHSQSTQGDAGQKLVTSPVKEDVVDAPASSLVQSSQCHCSWHGGTRQEDVPSSGARRTTFVLTVEFAGDSVEPDAATADDEGPPDPCLSTEEPVTPF